MSAFNLQGVIFDKDGVLMNSEPIYFRAYKDALTHFDSTKEYAWDIHKQFMGTSGAEKFEKIKNEFDIKVSLDEFRHFYRNRFLEIIESEGLTPEDGIDNLISELENEKIKYAIGTGSGKVASDLTLLKSGLKEKFDIVVTADDVVQGKPDPETFLLAAKRLDIQPHDCVVIGDSINDFLAAKSAGMKIVGVVDENYLEDPSLAVPDIKVRLLKEIDLKLLKSL